MDAEPNKLILGINASRARSGGAVAHLLGILNEGDPFQYGFREVHVWLPPELLEELPSKPWLVKHSPNALKGSIFRQILWERFSLPKLLQRVGCTILFNVDAGAVSKFCPTVTMSRDMLSYEPGEMERYNYLSKTRIRLILLRYIQNRSLKFSDGAIFLTRYAAGVIQESCGSLSNISYIPHGVGEEFTKARQINSWPKRDNPPIRCLYVSPIWAFKHQWVVVEAVHALREKGYNIKITFVGDGAKLGVNIQYNYEPELLGTAGGILFFLNNLKEEPYYVIYGDNYAEFDLKDLKDYHKSVNSDFTIVLHWVNDIRHCGVVDLFDDGRICKFVEKPNMKTAIGGWVNSGIYLINSGVIDDLVKQNSDFAYDIIPQVINRNDKIYGYKIKNDLWAIDTPELFSNTIKELNIN